MAEPDGESKGGEPQTRAAVPPVEVRGWHVLLSIGLMGVAAPIMGWLGLQAIETVDSEPLHTVVRATVVGVLLVTMVLGGKGIQAAGRISTASTCEETRNMVCLTRKHFSHQGLLMIIAFIVGALFEIWIRQG